MFSWSKIWKAVEGFFAKAIPVAINVAEDVEPGVDLLAPGIATFYNAGVTAAAKADQAAIQAGQQGDTTPAQQAAVAAAAIPYLTAYAQQLGAPAPAMADINKYAQLVVATLGIFAKIHASAPAPPATQTAPATA